MTGISSTARIAAVLCCLAPALALADDPPPTDTAAADLRFRSKVKADAADTLRRASGSSTTIDVKEI